MARPRSEFLGSLGKLFSIFKKVMDAVLLAGGSDEHIAQLDTNENLARQVAGLIMGRLKILEEHAPNTCSGVRRALFYEGSILQVLMTDGTTFKIGNQVLHRYSERKGWLLSISLSRTPCAAVMWEGGDRSDVKVDLLSIVPSFYA